MLVTGTWDISRFVVLMGSKYVLRLVLHMVTITIWSTSQWTYFKSICVTNFDMSQVWGKTKKRFESEKITWLDCMRVIHQFHFILSTLCLLLFSPSGRKESVLTSMQASPAGFPAICWCWQGLLGNWTNSFSYVQIIISIAYLQHRHHGMINLAQCSNPTTLHHIPCHLPQHHQSQDDI